MKTKQVNFIVGSTTYFRGEMPVECPHCGAFVSPLIQRVTGYSYHQDSAIYCATFIGECCNMHFFGLYRKAPPDTNASMLCIYPNCRPLQLPDAVHQISPRFVELYNQCYTAEQMGHFDLAGSGYRNAIEILVKDFAIRELHVPETDVIKKKLAVAIKAYLPSIDLKQSADVVRLLGNDYTHYDRKYDDVTFMIFKQYIEIFIKSIETTYLINHPVVKTQHAVEE